MDQIVCNLLLIDEDTVMIDVEMIDELMTNDILTY